MALGLDSIFMTNEYLNNRAASSVNKFKGSSNSETADRSRKV